MQLLDNRKYSVEGMMNMRDLGGYLTKEGSTTKFGQIIRSDVPYMLSDKSCNELKDLGITTIIDFRTPEELKKKPNILSNCVDYYNFPMKGGDKMPDSMEAIGPGYFAMAEDKKTILNIMKVISSKKGPIMLHCTAGKDRTGVVSALLLALAGVSEEDIAEDYYISWGNIKKLIDEMLRKNPNMQLFPNKREYIRECLKMINTKYGTVEKYFENVGLSKEEIYKIKAKLV